MTSGEGKPGLSLALVTDTECHHNKVMQKETLTAVTAAVSQMSLSLSGDSEGAKVDEIYSSSLVTSTSKKSGDYGSGYAPSRRCHSRSWAKKELEAAKSKLVDERFVSLSPSSGRKVAAVITSNQSLK